MSRPADPNLLGRVLAGKYEIAEYLGGGGMGAVYRARQNAIDKDVAVKVMHRDMAADPKFAERFQREAKAASRLDHVNSMRVMDYGEEPDGLLYIVMELLDGQNLHELLLEQWPFPARRVVAILSQALAALAVAHELGIIHRDLKPENIMILPGRSDDGEAVDVVKVCDFGIAKLGDGRGETSPTGAKLTAQGMMIGTPEYMSPEQARGDKLDPRSDLYSMGVILYQMLSGRLPFDGESALGIALKHVTDEASPPSAVVIGGVHPGLEVVCLRALSKKPADRYMNAREMRAALREALAGPSSISNGDRSSAVASTDPAPRLRIAETVPAGSLEGQAEQRFAVATAATLMTPSSGGTPAVKIVEAPKATLLGTAAVVTQPSLSLAPRRSLWPFAIVALAAIGAGVYLLRRPDPQAPVASASSNTAANGTPPPSISGDSVITPQPSVTAPPTVVASGSAPTPSTIPSPSLTITKVTAPPTSTLTFAPTTTATTTTVATTEPPPPPPATTSAAIATTAPPPPATTTAPTVAPPPPVDLSSASVSLTNVSTTNGVSGPAVRKALAPMPFKKCYVDALKVKGTAASGSANLLLSIDDTGHVTSATLAGATFLPGMAACIQTMARSAKIEADTGDATATVTLSFSSK